MSKKPRRVWRRKPPNKIKIIFCRGVYLTENTSQAAESSAAALCRAQPPQAALSASQYEFVCRRRANYARSRLQKLVGKARKGFFDSLKLPLRGSRLASARLRRGVSGGSAGKIQPALAHYTPLQSGLRPASFPGGEALFQFLQHLGKILRQWGKDQDGSAVSRVAKG